MRTRGSLLLAITILLAPIAMLRLLPVDWPFPLLVVECVAFWVLLPAYPLAAFAWWRARRRIALALTVIALSHLGWTCEWALRIDHAEGDVALRVLDTNLLAPRPSQALARELLSQDADVLVVQELSDEWLALLDTEGAASRYPHRVVEPHAIHTDYFGIGIFSRHPFDASGIDHLPGVMHAPLAWADVRVGDRVVRVESVHTAPPASSAWASLWREHFAYLVDRIEEASPDRTLIVAGDFNVSPFSFAHRRLLDTGLHEAHEAAGRGFAVTWPNGVFLAPPMRLDHVYVRRAGVRSVRELPSLSSDHSPIVVEIVL
jgi:endonuclease/exonuclease/phosphatase (EEP) superfamily protein YafD